MLFALTTRTIPFATPGNTMVIELPAGRPVIVGDWDLVDGERLFVIETELGEVCEGVPASALDFDADW